MIRRIALTCLLAATALGHAPRAHAQATTRSNEIGRPSDKDAVTVGRYVFAGVGIDEYNHPHLWKTLDNAVNDVDSVRSTLRTHFGFESPDAWILKDAEASMRGIHQLIDDLRANLQPEDNLIFFYAGHGAELVDFAGGQEVGRTGYVVPATAGDSIHLAESQYIEIQELLEDLSRLNARHVLVILDSCYSGMALTEELKMRGGPSAPSTRQARDLMQRLSRRVLTSAQADQLAADGGASFPDNSLFTGWLTAGLRAAATGVGERSADQDQDGMITATELFSFVSGRVGRASESNQTPDFGAFKYDQSGELVLLLERDPFTEAYEAALDALENDQIGRFEAAVEAALKEQEAGALPAHLRYLFAEVRYLTEETVEDADTILASLRELADLEAAGEETPLAGFALRRELKRAEKECQRIGCASVGDPR